VVDAVVESPSAGAMLVCSRSLASAICSTSTRAACHADQCPDTSAHNDSADTYETLLSKPKKIENGIMTIQKIVSHPLTRRMNTGRPTATIRTASVASWGHDAHRRRTGHDLLQASPRFAQLQTMASAPSGLASGSFEGDENDGFDGDVRC
jgi:hypothetical protein